MNRLETFCAGPCHPKHEIGLCGNPRDASVNGVVVGVVRGSEIVLGILVHICVGCDGREQLVVLAKYVADLRSIFSLLSRRRVQVGDDFRLLLLNHLQRVNPTRLCAFQIFQPLPQATRVVFNLGH